MRLDVAKDYQQQAMLTALEELIRQGEIALILPHTVVDEFAAYSGLNDHTELRSVVQASRFGMMMLASHSSSGGVSASPAN